jgi:hypothetical protein
MTAHIKNIFKLHSEWSILLIGLILLAFMDPTRQSLSLCLFDVAGIFCPGEGLGRSISYIFRGMWSEAWNSHPAGFIAVPVLSVRILQVFYIRIINPNQ